jgi:cbb3-type cytochrome oxidase subunit 1
MPKQEVLVEEHRQLIESQRDNTHITYSWIGNIFLVLSLVLFLLGLTTDKWSQFIPAMFLDILLAIVWIGLTNVFVRHIRAL